MAFKIGNTAISTLNPLTSQINKFNYKDLELLSQNIEVKKAKIIKQTKEDFGILTEFVDPEIIARLPDVKDLKLRLPPLNSCQSLYPNQLVSPSDLSHHPAVRGTTLDNRVYIVFNLNVRLKNKSSVVSEVCMATKTVHCKCEEETIPPFVTAQQVISNRYKIIPSILLKIKNKSRPISEVCMATKTVHCKCEEETISPFVMAQQVISNRYKIIPSVLCPDGNLNADQMKKIYALLCGDEIGFINGANENVRIKLVSST